MREALGAMREELGSCDGGVMELRGRRYGAAREALGSCEGGVRELRGRR